MISRMAGIQVVLILVVAGWLAVTPAWAAETVGSVTRLQNDATAKSVDDNRGLAVGDAIFNGDVLSTGSDARLEVTLTDGSVLTLGANAVLEASDFVYDPDNASSVSALDVLSGAFLMVTGAIAKDQPGNVRVTIGSSIVGIRGTQFWGGPIDGAHGVLVLDGIISVTTSAGTVVLDTPGQGTTVVDAVTQPTDPIIWGDEKKARAIATVTFAQ